MDVAAAEKAEDAIAATATATAAATASTTATTTASAAAAAAASTTTTTTTVHVADSTSNTLRLLPLLQYTAQILPAILQLLLLLRAHDSERQR